MFQLDRITDDGQDLSNGGIMIACSTSLLPESFNIPHSSILEVKSISITTCSNLKMCIMAVYRRPQLPLATFLPLLDNYLSKIPAIPTVVLRDFNNDLLPTPSSSRLIKLMSSKGFSQLITVSTTDSGSLLDHIYFNAMQIESIVDVVDIHYSNHDATYTCLPKQTNTVYSTTQQQPPLHLSTLSNSLKTEPSTQQFPTVASQSTNIPYSPSSSTNLAPKPSPPLQWKQQAIATLQKYTSMLIIDRNANPDLTTYEECPEINPHLLNRVIGDGHCGFRALSKAITGTEVNHIAFRAATVAFMKSSCADRRRPWIVQRTLYPTIDAYIDHRHMTSNGWMSDVEILYFASLLNIPISVFLTVGERTH